MVRDETRLPTAASADLGFETFRSRAAAELLSHSADISRILAAAENSPARWHPNSFVVFELPLVGRWGDLRLHVWPVGDRVVRGWGPIVHRHGWHLASHVLAGCYSDVLFEDVRTCPEGGTWRRTHAYMVDVPANQPDVIRPVGQVVYVREIERRQVPAGSFHYIPAGVFHDTLIPSDVFAATLVVRSGEGVVSSLVLDDAEAPVRTYRRPVVSGPQRARVLTQLRDATRA